jgi:hypothetical protein
MVYRGSTPAEGTLHKPNTHAEGVSDGALSDHRPPDQRRPDPNGWQSSGTGVPAFSVEAAGAAHAAAIGHDVVGYGVRLLMRKVVHV